MKEIEHKLALIGAGKREYMKLLKKADKNMQKRSDKLRKAHDTDTSMKRRADLRIKLDNACEERDRLLKTVRIAENWLNELRKKL